MGAGGTVRARGVRPQVGGGEERREWIEECVQLESQPLHPPGCGGQVPIFPIAFMMRQFPLNLGTSRSLRVYTGISLIPHRQPCEAALFSPGS